MKTFKPPANYGKSRRQRTLMLLERWAEEHRVELLKILEVNEPGEMTPDYKAIFPDADRTEVIVEVKEITTPFEMDTESFTINIPEAGPRDGRSSLGAPVRHKIRAARPQLKPHADAGYLTLLLLGAWTPALDSFLDWSIPIAMYGGGPQIRLQVEGVVSDLLITSTARGGRQLADNTNRSVSGIGQFKIDYHKSPKKLRLAIYRHNNPRIVFNKALPGIEYTP